MTISSAPSHSRFADSDQSFSLDIRSDTVTTPSRAMREAMANAAVGDDVLDGDPTVRQLELHVAELLGKERALFFPSGSMANVTAIALHTTPGTEILVDADAHILEGEIAAAAGICGVQVLPVRGATAVFTAADLRATIRTPSIHSPEPSLVCIENTHNGAGGVITPLAEMRAVADVAREHHLPVHLDGARLWNASAASGTSLRAFAAVVDTVMVSFSKGLGAPVGAALAGTAQQMERAHRIRKRLGGGMRQSGIIAAGALYALQHNLGRLVEDHAAAREFAALVDGAGGARVVPPDTNIIMVDLPEPRAFEMVARAEEQGVRLTAWHQSRIRAVTHLDAPVVAVREAGRILRALLEGAA